MDNINALEEKVSLLLSAFEDLRKKNEQNQEKISILEKDKEELQNKISDMSSEGDAEREKNNEATKKIEGILEELDKVLS